MGGPSEREYMEKFGKFKEKVNKKLADVKKRGLKKLRRPKLICLGRLRR